jgi:MFS family permease
VAVTAVSVADFAGLFGIAEDPGALLAPALAITVGSMAAWPLSSAADRLGRKPLLIAATFGFATFTGATAAATDMATFTVLQGIARVFLITSVVLAVVVAVEEFPSYRRGYVVGVLGAFGALGLPVSAGALVALRATPVGFRGLYLAGALPLLLVPVMMRTLKETRRFGMPGRRPSLLRSEVRREVLLVGVLFLLVQLGIFAALTSFASFAVEEVGLAVETMRLLQAAAIIAGVFGYLAAGRMQDRWGRRRTSTLFLLGAAAFGAGVFQAGSAPSLAVLTPPAAFFGLGVSAVLSAMGAELFPTKVRAGALGLARGVFATIGALAGPVAVAALASATPAIGDAATITALALLVAAALVWLLPETARRELESISASSQILKAPPTSEPRPSRVILPGSTPPPARPRAEPPPSPITPQEPRPYSSRPPFNPPTPPRREGSDDEEGEQA